MTSTPSLLTSIFLLGCLLAVGCSQPQHKQTMDDGRDLQMRVRAFHTDMRWGRYEAAANVVVEEERHRFLGRYEALGDDFKIADMELIAVRRPSSDEAIVEIDQQSYKEPQMTVKKQTFLELWERRDGQWLLAKRLEEDEWEAWRSAQRTQEPPEDASDDEGEESPRPAHPAEDEEP